MHVEFGGLVCSMLLLAERVVNKQKLYVLGLLTVTFNKKQLSTIVTMTEFRMYSDIHKYLKIMLRDVFSPQCSS